MRTQQELTQALVNSSVLKTPTLIRIFETVNRTDFVPAEHEAEAHEDSALPIGSEQTISQPQVVAYMLELLQPQPGDTVLDIGSGSGWTTTLLAEAVEPGGYVYAIERVPELVEQGRENIAKYYTENAQVLQAGDKLGLPQEAPFDKILVSAAAQKPPESLLEQLRSGGTMVIPIEDAIWQIHKRENDSLRVERYGGFAFVPLIEDE